MIQLVYASAATQPMSTNELNALLRRARSKNRLYEVTGMLLYHSGSFLQVLEGPESGIETIYRSIDRDPRHVRPKILSRENIRRREFDGWSMGFSDTSDLLHRPEGFVEYRTLPALADASSRAGQYLRFFKQGLCRQTTRVAG